MTASPKGDRQLKPLALSTPSALFFSPQCPKLPVKWRYGTEVRHLHLASRDHLQSQRFYEVYFGFHFDSVFPRCDQPAATILRSPSRFQIYLEGPNEGRLHSWFHFGFLVASDAACRELHDRMQRNGVPIVRPLTSEPFTNYFCTDPDMHLVQVYFDPKVV